MSLLLRGAIIMMDGFDPSCFCRGCQLSERRFVQGPNLVVSFSLGNLDTIHRIPQAAPTIRAELPFDRGDPTFDRRNRLGSMNDLVSGAAQLLQAVQHGLNALPPEKLISSQSGCGCYRDVYPSPAGGNHNP